MSRFLIRFGLCVAVIGFFYPSWSRAAGDYGNNNRHVEHYGARGVSVWASAYQFSEDDDCVETEVDIYVDQFVEKGGRVEKHPRAFVGVSVYRRNYCADDDLDARIFAWGEIPDLDEVDTKKLTSANVTATLEGWEYDHEDEDGDENVVTVEVELDLAANGGVHRSRDGYAFENECVRVRSRSDRTFKYADGTFTVSINGEAISGAIDGEIGRARSGSIVKITDEACYGGKG